MKYYAWAGWQNKKLHFAIEPILKIHGDSEYHQGWLIVDTDIKNAMHNFSSTEIGKNAQDDEVEVDKLHIVNTMKEARRKVVRDLFAK